MRTRFWLFDTVGRVSSRSSGARQCSVTVDQSAPGDYSPDPRCLRLQHGQLSSKCCFSGVIGRAGRFESVFREANALFASESPLVYCRQTGFRSAIEPPLERGRNGPFNPGVRAGGTRIWRIPDCQGRRRSRGSLGNAVRFSRPFPAISQPRATGPISGICRHQRRAWEQVRCRSEALFSGTPEVNPGGHGAEASDFSLR